MTTPAIAAELTDSPVAGTYSVILKEIYKYFMTILYTYCKLLNPYVIKEITDVSGIFLESGYGS